MSGEFKVEGEWRPPREYMASKPPKIIEWVIRYSGGLVKTEQQAVRVLVLFSMLLIIISLFLVFSGSSSYEEKITPTIPAAGSRRP